MKPKISITFPSDVKNIIKYTENIKAEYDFKVDKICGYEAGCLGYSLLRETAGTIYILVYKENIRDSMEEEAYSNLQSTRDQNHKYAANVLYKIAKQQ